MIHVLEHLNKPSEVLSTIGKKLKKNGIIFSEMIWELDSQEAKVIFSNQDFINKDQFSSVEDQAKVMFERNGIDIRIVNNQVSKIIFQDIYEWLWFQCWSASR